MCLFWNLIEFSILVFQAQLIENTTLDNVHENLFARVPNGLYNKITSGRD